MTKNYSKFKNRIRFITSIVMLVWIIFFVQLFTIQIIEGIDNPQGIREEIVKGKRGNIFDVNDISCYGFGDGTVELEFTGGNPNYSLQLFRDGVNTQLEPDSDILGSISYTISDLLEGSYALYVSDIYGCDNSLNPLTFEIIEPEDIILIDTIIRDKDKTVLFIEQRYINYALLVKRIFLIFFNLGDKFFCLAVIKNWSKLPFLSTVLIPALETVNFNDLFNDSLLNLTFFKFGKNLLFVLLLA